MTFGQKKLMKCFLLTAGYGNRLRPLTETIPKCLLPIGGKPLLAIWLEHLKLHGIDELLINTHWLHEKVVAFLKTWKEDRPKIIPFHESTLLGSAGTLLANSTWVRESGPFFIIYGDTLTSVDLTKMLGFHNQHGMPLTLGVFRTDKPKECGIVEISNNGVVTGFVEKPEEPATDLAAAGVYVADNRIFELFPEIDPVNRRAVPQPLDLGLDVIPMLVGRMKAYLIKEFIIDIGTRESYEKAQRLWSQVLVRKNTNSTIPTYLFLKKNAAP